MTKTKNTRTYKLPSMSPSPVRGSRSQSLEYTKGVSVLCKIVRSSVILLLPLFPNKALDQETNMGLSDIGCLDHHLDIGYQDHIPGFRGQNRHPDITFNQNPHPDIRVPSTVSKGSGQRNRSGLR